VRRKENLRREKLCDAADLYSSGSKGIRNPIKGFQIPIKFLAEKGSMSGKGKKIQFEKGSKK